MFLQSGWPLLIIRLCGHRSNCLSLFKWISTQYLKTKTILIVSKFHTNVIPRNVWSLINFKGQISKDQGQTADPYPKCCQLNIVWPLLNGYKTCYANCFKGEKMISISFRYTKAKSNNSSSRRSSLKMFLCVEVTKYSRGIYLQL